MITHNSRRFKHMSRSSHDAAARKRALACGAARRLGTCMSRVWCSILWRHMRRISLARESLTECHWAGKLKHGSSMQRRISKQTRTNSPPTIARCQWGHSSRLLDCYPNGASCLANLSPCILFWMSRNADVLLRSCFALTADEADRLHVPHSLSLCTWPNRRAMGETSQQPYRGGNKAAFYFRHPCMRCLEINEKRCHRLEAGSTATLRKYQWASTETDGREGPHVLPDGKKRGTEVA